MGGARRGVGGRGGVKIVCAASVLLGREAFSPFGEVRVIGDREIGHGDLVDAEALIIRSGTKVTEELIGGTGLRFIGTATAGADHLDFGAMARHGIVAASAPGCNANSVAEAVVSMLAYFSLRRGSRLCGKTLGVVGCGHIGSLVAKKAECLGLRVLRNDPPKARRGGVGYVGLGEVLARSDVVTLHVPLTVGGEDATAGLVGGGFFAAMRKGAWFFNTSRGGVVAMDALAEARGRLGAVWLDVWENEPNLPANFPRAGVVFTPHIAGYSYEGRVAGTGACRRALCRFLGRREGEWGLGVLGKGGVVDGLGWGCGEEALMKILLAVSVLPERDAGRWREVAEGLRGVGLRREFDEFRRRYPVRREYGAYGVRVKRSASWLGGVLGGLGFTVEAVG